MTPMTPSYTVDIPNKNDVKAKQNAALALDAFNLKKRLAKRLEDGGTMLHLLENESEAVVELIRPDFKAAGWDLAVSTDGLFLTCR